MSFLRFFIVSLAICTPFSLFAFDPSCFREVAIIENPPLSTLQVALEGRDENIFFLQSDVLLASKIVSTEKVPSIRYSITPEKNSKAVTDFDPETYLQVDPYALSRGDVIFTVDLLRIYNPGEVAYFFDFSTSGKVGFEISQDGSAYFPVTLSAIEDFPVRYIRMTFEKVESQAFPTIIRSIDFFENVTLRYLIVPKSSETIEVYRNTVCDTKKFIVPSGGAISPMSLDYRTIRFTKNPSYKNDFDADGIENIEDVCPYIPDSTQKDRNFDGRGDACTDDDGDSIVGDTDNCPTIANPDQKDINVNGIGDACEFDTDSDGIPDGNDNAMRVQNPGQEDADGDSIGDIIDNCNLYNSDQLDLDKNGIGDVCDRDTEYKKTNDSDADGILDFVDNCMKSPNNDQNDKDNDGIGDVCDNCPALQNNDQKDENKNNQGDMCEDVDNDSIVGWRDNCPTLYNPTQEDSDNDMVGNACTDTDNDSVVDSLDICPTQYNPLQEDIDRDGIGDVCDTSDSRFVESNKYFFMGIIAFFSAIFIAGILFLLKKLH